MCLMIHMTIQNGLAVDPDCDAAISDKDCDSDEYSMLALNHKVLSKVALCRCNSKGTYTDTEGVDKDWCDLATQAGKKCRLGDGREVSWGWARCRHNGIVLVHCPPKDELNVGDFVTWTHVDSSTPTGTVGTILEFDLARPQGAFVDVDFPGGTSMDRWLPPWQLLKVATCKTFQKCRGATRNRGKTQACSGTDEASCNADTCCEPCEANCAKCQGQTCTQCRNSKYLHKGNCTAKCPLGRYKSGTRKVGRKCRSCKKWCLKCPGGTCTRCGWFKILINGRCRHRCPSGYREAKDKAGRYRELLHMGAKDEAKDRLPANGRYCQACGADCVQCTTNRCSKCGNSLYLFNGKCQATCPTSHRAVGSDKEGRVCEAKATCDLISTPCSGNRAVNKGPSVTCSAGIDSCDAATCCEAVPSKVMRCMNNILCFKKLPVSLQTNNAWKCNCVWQRSGKGTRPPTCKLWDDCLEKRADAHGQEVLHLMKNLEKAVFLHDTSFLESSQVRKVATVGPGPKVATAKAHCFEPLTTRLEEVACNCLDKYHKFCEEAPGDEKARCLRDMLCAHKYVCAWWRNTCSADEIERGTNIIKTADKKTAGDNATSMFERGHESSDSLDESLTHKKTC